MTKYPSSDTGASPEGDEFYFEEAESGIPGQLKDSPLFRDAAFFNGKNLEKMRPKKIAKFRASRRPEGDF